jgi:hypothetical protein
LYSDIVYFLSLLCTVFRKLDVAFNAFIMYIFEYEEEKLGCNLFTYYEIDLAVFNVFIQ